MPFTRFGLEGYGVRRVGTFSGKAISTHPVGILTRLSMDGYGARRNGSFAGKTADSGVVATEPNVQHFMNATMGRMFSR